MKITDYNDFADKWIALMAEVKRMHDFSLKSHWKNAGECAEVCAVLAGELKTIFEGYHKK